MNLLQKYIVSFAVISILLFACLYNLSSSVKHTNETFPTEFKGAENRNIEKNTSLNLSNNLINQVSFPKDSNSSYVNNKITGYWNTKHLTKRGVNNDGHRVIYAVYNPIEKVFYAVSHTRSLYRIDPTKKNQWELVNNKIPISHFSKGYKRVYPLTGVVTDQNTFRLILQGTIGANLYYSDTGGRSWQASSGLDGSGIIPYETFVSKLNNKSRIIAFGGQLDSNFKGYKISFSDDYGLTYTSSSINGSWAFSNSEVRLAHSLHSDYSFALVRNKMNNTVALYQLAPNKSDFELVKNFTEPIQQLTNFKVSYGEGKHHFYVRENSKLHYFNENDTAWTVKNNDIKASTESSVYLAAVHPTKPNNLYYGFTDLFLSTDGGVTANGIKHGLDKFYVWDVENFQFFKKTDDSFVAFIGSHFGSFFNENVTDIKTWQTASNGCPAVMPYDATYSEKFGVGYTANQDKGTMQYFDGGKTNALETSSVIGGDCFRVTLSNDENSVWYTKLGGTLFFEEFNSDFLSTRTRQIQHGFDSDFWGSNLIISPNTGENAVYLTGAKNLKKFTDNGSISASDHPFTFTEKTQGFGYSKLNRNNWYVSDAAGTFYYSTDGGNTFNPTAYKGVTPGSAESSIRRQHQILADVIDQNKVYYAGISNNFLVSTDHGKNFKNHNNGLNVKVILGLDSSPDGKYIFAACGTDGPWIYAVDEDKWFPMHGNAVDRKASYNTVQFLKTKNSVRYTSYGGGISDFVIKENFSSWKRIETENNSYFTFDNNWAPYTYQNGTKVHFTNNKNSELDIQFQGEEIRLYGIKRADLGKLEIFIDGKLVETIDTYSPTLKQNTLIFETNNLNNQIHSLKIVATGEKNPSSSGIEIVIDGIEVKEKNFKLNGYQQIKNLAPFASVTASSEFSTKYKATNATDNSLFDGRGILEWASKSSIDSAPYLELKWDKNVIVDKVILYDRKNSDVNILKSEIIFSDGESKNVNTLQFWGKANVIEVNNKVTNSLKFKVLNSQGNNVGLQEIMVIGTFEDESDPNIAPYATIANSNNELQAFTALKDENISNQWTSNLEEVTKITLTWDSEVTISAVQLFENKDNASIREGKLIFDNGDYADVRAFGNNNGVNFTKLKFNDISTKSLTYEVSHSEAKRINLSEIKVFGKSQSDITLNITDNAAPENFNPQIKIYPNPTTDILHINGSSSNASTAMLFDLNGRILDKFSFVTNHTLNVSKYASNRILILKIKTDKRTTSHKIVFK